MVYLTDQIGVLLGHSTHKPKGWGNLCFTDNNNPEAIVTYVVSTGAAKPAQS